MDCLDTLPFGETGSAFCCNNGDFGNGDGTSGTSSKSGSGMYLASLSESAIEAFICAALMASMVWVEFWVEFFTGEPC